MIGPCRHVILYKYFVCNLCESVSAWMSPRQETRANVLLCMEAYYWYVHVVLTFFVYAFPYTVVPCDSPVCVASLGLCLMSSQRSFVTCKFSLLSRSFWSVSVNRIYVHSCSNKGLSTELLLECFIKWHRHSARTHNFYSSFFDRR